MYVGVTLIFQSKQRDLAEIKHYFSCIELGDFYQLRQKIEKMGGKDSATFIYFNINYDLTTAPPSHCNIHETIRANIQNNLDFLDATTIHLSGFQFLTVLANVDTTKLRQLSNTLRFLLNNRLQIGESSYYIQTTIGTSIWPSDSADFNTLVKYAYLASCIARKTTKGVAHFKDSYRQAATRQFDILNGICRNLSANKISEQLYIVYQPKVCLNDGKLSGVEALVRWNHPTIGKVPPSEFIPLIEKTEMINSLTLRVLELVCDDLHFFFKRNKNFCVAVNISGKDLMNPSFANQVSALIKKHDIPPDLLELEITETSLLLNMETASQQLRKLKNIGVKISIDDFGTGYSSLSYLAKMPVDYLKIDASLTQSLLEEKASIIVKSLIDLASKLNLGVIAEGVESSSVLEKLKQMQCDFAQGFYLSRPLSKRKLMNYLNTNFQS